MPATVHFRELDARSFTLSGSNIVSSGVASLSGYYLVISPEVLNSLGGGPNSTTNANTIASSALKQSNFDPQQPASDFAATNWATRGWTDPGSDLAGWKTQFQNWVTNNLDNSTINPGLGDFNFYLVDTTISGTRYIVPIVYLGNDQGIPLVTDWTPAAIATGLWLDAADSSTLVLSGSNVSQWNDKSGNSRHLSQADAGARPSVSETLNGLSVVSFNGVTRNEFMTSATNALGTTSQFAAYGVCKFAAATQVNYDYVWQNGIFASGSVLSLSRNAGDNRYYCWDGSSQRFGPTLNNSPLLFTQHFPSGVPRHLFWLNGNPGAVDELSGPFTLSGTFRVGMSSEHGHNLAGFIGELIAINTVPTTETREKIEGYLAWKWGLTANLPANHPYKSVKPSL